MVKIGFTITFVLLCIWIYWVGEYMFSKIRFSKFKDGLNQEDDDYSNIRMNPLDITRLADSMSIPESGEDQLNEMREMTAWHAKTTKKLKTFGIATILFFIVTAVLISMAK